MSEPTELWRPVVGWEGLYEVSDQGRVRSLPRTTTKGRVLKLRLAEGYPAVSLSKEAVVRTRKVHKLVIEAFIGPCPEGLEVRHLNGVSTDARLLNLRYGTRSENARDRVLHGTHNHASKSCCPKCGGPYAQRRSRNQRYCIPCNNAVSQPKITSH